MAVTTLWQGTLRAEERRRPTTEIAAFVVDTKRDTIPAPSKVCTCCDGTVSFAEWMANASRRPWMDLGVEIAEHDCKSTLAERVNALPLVTR